MTSKSAHIFATAFGYAGIIFRLAPFELRQIFLPCSNENELRRQMHSPDLDGGFCDEVKEAADLIRAYFSGLQITIPWQWLELSRFSPAEAQVYRQVALIPYGRTASYGQVAVAVGRPRAARFVGRCMAQNPYPVLIPCHRVIRRNGSLGGFAGGLALKQRMLDLEADT